MLAGVNVALGVTGSIAAVKCVEMIHELQRHGATVRAITTPAVESILNPWALEFATEKPVVTEITGAIEHVELCGNDGWADVFLIAPATANTIGKMASTVDDTPVTTCATTAIGADLPIVIGPAMHEPMWNHPGVIESMETLEAWGISFIPPRVEEEKAKIAGNDAIVTATATAVSDQSLDGIDVVITAGATEEEIDPIRTITNRASGKTGRAIARACSIRGATVTLIENGPDRSYASVKQVATGEEMQQEALDACEKANIFVSTAAISDFTVETATEKLDSKTEHTITLTPAPKVLDTVKEAYPELHCIGFKAEHAAEDADLIDAARDQLERIDAPFVVANDASVMGDDESRIIIVEASAETPLTGDKTELAEHIVDKIVEIVNDA